MSVIQIPVFDGGLVTYADPEDINPNSATSSVNFETEEHGKLVKRKGRADGTTMTGDNISAIQKWSIQDLSAPLWIYYEYQEGKIKSCAANFSSPAEIKELANTVSEIDISNYGRALRFANGTTNKAGIYQKIDRKYFFGGNTFDSFDYDDAAPSFPGVWDPQNITEIGTGVKQSGHYYYKFVPVFDGNQEAPLPESFSYHAMTNNNKSLRTAFKMKKGTGSTGGVKDFNERITAIKVYRSYSTTATGNIDPVYYHVFTIPLNTKSTHDDILASQAVSPLDNMLYVSGNISDEPSGWGSLSGSGAKGLILGTYTTNNTVNGNQITHYFSESSWPGNTWGGLFTLVTSTGSASSVTQTAHKIFNGAYTIAIKDQNNDWNVEFSANEGGFAGKNVIYKSTFDYHAGEAAGNVVYNSSITGMEHVVVDSMERALKLDSDTDQTSDFAVDITKGYRYAISGDDVTLYFYDYDLNDQGLHPLGNKTKITVNHKYSTYLGSRQFVGNVRLDPDGDAEDHEDWIIYSELGQPDVLPITNFIQIKDIQGGAITGLTTHLGNLIVFMERGVYRLEIPSSDPSNWSLIESEENIGCTAPDSIITIGGQTFFAGNDNAYVMDPGFNIYPITTPIKDVYQAKSNIEQSRFFYDVKKGRMLCRFGSDKQNIYSFDVQRSKEGQAIWYTLDMGSTDVADIFAIDENLDVYSITNGV